MNCETTLNILDEVLDDSLSLREREAFFDHLSSCKKCRHCFNRAKQIHDALPSLPIIPPSKEFSQYALQRAIRGNVNHHHRRGFIVGFSSAVAAMVLIAVVIGQFIVNPRIENELIQDFAIRLHETKDIKLVFSAPRNLTHAKVTIRLPAHITLVGFPGQQELTWVTDLVQGENLLRLPVIAQNRDAGQIVARIEHEQKVKTFRLALKIDAEGLSQNFENFEFTSYSPV